MLNSDTTRYGKRIAGNTNHTTGKSMTSAIPAASSGSYPSAIPWTGAPALRTPVPGQPPLAEVDVHAKIMMVDDERLNILLVGEYLRKAGYDNFISTEDPREVLSLAKRDQPSVVLLDIHMPRLSGLEILQHLRSDAQTRYTPVIVLTASTDDEVKIQALELGATDFITKPVHRGELLARLRNILMAKAYQDHLRDYSITLEAAVLKRTAELEASRQDIIHCLARAAEFRDDDTGEHIIRVGRYARVIGDQLGLDKDSLDILEQAAKLHDIGKIGIPDEILLKPGSLTPEQAALMQQHSSIGKSIIEGRAETEYELLKRHTEIGSQILDAGNSPLLAVAMRIALTHHERWDGSGYPLGLAGEDIPLEGRITAVADVFDALSAKRPYKPAFPLEKCLSILEEGRGTHFDPVVLDAFQIRCDEIVSIQREYVGNEA